MRSGHDRIEAVPFVGGEDPRQQGSAEIIDLTTRQVLPTVSQQRKADGLGTVAGIGIVAALGAFTLFALSDARTAPKAATKTAQAQRSAPFGYADPGIYPEARPTFVRQPATFGVPQSQYRIAHEPQGAEAASPETENEPGLAVNDFAAPTVVFDASAMPSPAAERGQRPPMGDDFENRIGGVGGGSATARAMASPKTTVTQGTIISAVLETAINTDVPGFTRAVVSADVRSFDGSRVLIPRSSRLIGQYRSGLQAGQRRAYVIWTRLIRPDGVSVDLASPGTSFSGETGLGGSVNNHFFSRFGSAMLLSVLGGLSALGSGGATTIVAGGGQSAAAAAVGQTGQIGPTVRVRQGEPVRVFTARDLDFSRVGAG